MKKLITYLTLTILAAISFASLAQAQEIKTFSKDKFFKAEVVEITEENDNIQEGYSEFSQTAKVQIKSKASNNEIVEIQHNVPLDIKEQKALRVGDKIAINQVGDSYYYVDKYRLPGLILVIFLFALVSVIFGGSQGARSFISLAISVAILIKFTVPMIVAGHSPLLISLITSVAIAFFALYVSHGFKKRIHIALAGLLIAMVLSVLISLLFTKITLLFGLGSEDAYNLLLGPLDNVDFKGILLGGILISTMGILDDITTAQASVIEELHKANPRQNFKQLYTAANSVGQEHISALINTLFLAYAGASLPLFIIMATDNVPSAWIIANDSYLVEEIVRTIVGSMSLILAVPITTSLAAYYYSKEN